MNSLSLAYSMRTMSITSSTNSMPEPPESLHFSSSTSYELDCSKFDCGGLSPSTPSLASLSYNSLASQESSLSQQSSSTLSSQGNINGWGSTLSRSRCVHNLSALGCSSSADVGVSTRSARDIPPYESTPNEGWGYYADTR